MEKSNYEEYAEKKQKEILKNNVSLNDCIEQLKKNKAIFSKEYMEAQIELVAQVFGLISEEVEGAVNGKEYWCLQREVII